MASFGIAVRESDMSSNSASRSVIIGHPQGLHLRPSAEIAKALGMYQSRVEIRHVLLVPRDQSP